MRRTTSLLAATALSLGTIAAANAGGFQRGTADTDILFEPGTFSTRAGLTYVNPKRGFETIDGQAGDFGDYTGDYTIPSYAVKFGGDAFACAGHYVESFAAEADYTGSPDGALPAQPSGPGVTSRTQTIEFDSNEVGATCRVSYANDIGRFSLLGGLFAEDFNFQGASLGFRNVTSRIAALPGVQGQLDAISNAFGSPASIILPTSVAVDNRGGFEGGYRVGLAYERPEIALRVQGLYRSEVVHDSITGSGTLAITGAPFVQVGDQQIAVPALAVGAAAAGLPTGRTIDVDSRLNTAISPQYFTLSGQTGIAEGTLLLASLRWTDWSTNNVVINSISGSLDGRPIGSAAEQPYYWRDGWTGSLGVGRAFSENISGAVAVGYDRGVSTGADTTYTDLYTLSGGVIIRQDFAEVRFGGLVGYWTDGEQSTDDRANFDATVGEDWVYGANVALKLTF